MADLRETLHVDAPAALVYSVIADLPRMPEWSPECERVRWRGVSQAAKGASFVAINKAGTLRWVTFGRVVVADEPRYLAWQTSLGPVAISLWEYFVVPDDDGPGCTIAEQWTDHRALPARVAVDKVLGSRVLRNRTAMRATLAALKRVAEAEAR